MINYIIREVEPEACEFSYYFDDDGLTEAGGDYCYNLFIIDFDSWRGRKAVFNETEYSRLQRQARDIIEDFELTAEYIENGDRDENGKRATYKEVMELYGIPYNSRKCHALKEWAKDADEDSPEDMAEYLTIITGKKWDVTGVHGYCQGDYVELVYCPEYYKDGVTAYGEVWLGCAKEFCVVEIENYQEPEDEDDEPTYKELDSCYGFIVADCQARSDEDYKRLVCEWADIPEGETRLEMIDGYHTYTQYSYRTA